MLEKLDGYRPSQPLRILIADRAEEHDLGATRMVGRMQCCPVDGEVPGRQLTSIIDSIHFVDSKDSLGVQLADSVAYLLQRSSWTGSEHPDAKAMVEKLAGAIGGKVKTYRWPWP
jgi:hypothetical protein